MRKFIFNTSILSSIFGGWGAVQATRRGPKDWRLVLLWLSWAMTVAIAVGTVIKDDHDALDEVEE